MSWDKLRAKKVHIFVVDLLREKRSLNRLYDLFLKAKN